MDPVPSETPLTPRPGLLKTIGVLNLLIGGSLFLCGLGCLSQLGPSVAQNQPMTLDPEVTQQIYEQLRNEQILDLEKREKAATKDPLKAELRRERLALEAKHPKIDEQLNLNAINRDLLWLTWYLWADVITGPVLNLLLLASGIGLIQLRGWARTMGLWVAALKIVRLAALTLLLLLVVVPHLGRTMEALLATDLGRAVVAKSIAENNARQGGAAPAAPLEPGQLGPWFKALGNIFAIFTLAFGAIYPAIALVVLTRPAARDACIPANDPESGEDENNNP